MTTTQRSGRTGQRQPIPSRPKESIAAARRRALRHGLRGMLLSTADIRVLRWCGDETARGASDDPCLCNYVELL